MVKKRNEQDKRIDYLRDRIKNLEETKTSHLTVLLVAVVLVVVTVAFTQVLSSDIAELKEQLAGMPKRVCHTETKTEAFTIKSVFDPIRTFPFNTEILCEDGVRVVEYDALGKKVIYGYSNEVGKTCIVKTKKEVCEIK
ncbi:MAG: hypothetical protein KAS04_04895 [Candidatus Aenigmarchaeota archaeon]|nr:hypothetical protein [Candidatus Aenigmarchaeota archaeon]